MATPGPTAQRAYTPAAPVLVFLSARYEGEGWACLGYIDGDPSIKKGQPGYSPMQQEWFAWPREAEAMAARYAELEERGLNLYLGQCLFSTQKRAYTTALPSRWLWADDAPFDAKCSELVQSSANSYQAWLKLDTLLGARERGELQRRWRVMLHGDACSANAVGMVRAPIGYNTKRHGRFPVRVVGGTGSRFKLADVAAKLPLVAKTARAENGTPADWSKLPSGAGLAKSSRFKRACQRPQLKTIIIDGGRVALPGKDGADDSGSMQVAVFVNNLLGLYKPYPDAEVRALALHYRETLRPGVDTARFQADVDRLLVTYRPKHKRQEATRYVPGVSGEINVCTHQEAKRRGRPAGKSANHQAQLLKLVESAASDDFGRVPVDTAKLAEAVGVTRRRVLQLLGELTKSGEIKSFTAGTRWRSAFVVRSEATQSQETPIQPSQNQVKLNQADLGAVEATNSRAQSGESASAEQAPLERTRDHVPGVYSLSTAPVSPDVPKLAAAVTELFDAAGPGARVTHKRAVQYFTANYPTLRYGLGALRGELEAERERRQRAKKLAGLANLKVPGLKAELRLAEYLHEKSEAQQSNEARWWAFYASAIKAELHKRPAESTKPKRRGMLEAVRTPRQAAEMHEQQMLEQVAADRTRQPLPRRTAVAVRVDTPAQTQPAPDPFAQIKSLVARLKARLA